jgi:hypothetical protein
LCFFGVGLFVEFSSFSKFASWIFRFLWWFDKPVFLERKINYMSLRSLISCVVLVVSASASAKVFSLSDIEGKWNSTKVYSLNSSNDPTAGQFLAGFQLEFDQQRNFSLTRTLTYKSGDVTAEKSSGAYTFSGVDITAIATATEMTYQGQTTSASVSPGSGLILTVINVGPDTMTLQMGKEDFYIDLQRVP